MTDSHSDTIAAIATASGAAGVGIIRVSGDLSLAIANAIAKTPSPYQARHLHYTQFFHPHTKAFIDEGCLIYCPGPKSFTGEDVIEFHCHGSPLVLQQLLRACLAEGARLAHAGEFSKRALMNGKIDLSKAEALIDLIEADSNMAMQISLSKVQGQLYQHIQSARAALMHLLQHIEASIDFPDEVEGITEPEFYEAIAPAQKLLDDAHNLKDFGRRVKSGTRAIILGYPNVGKSSLFNRLLGESRAIVSQTAGTTRDYIETDIELGGLLFHLFDTAGFRSETSDDIEVAGIQKISQLKDESDVLIWVLDGTRELCTDEQRFLGELPDYDGEVLILINKRDHEDFDLTHIPQDPLSAWPQLIISTQNTEDISALKSEILKLVPAPSSEQHWAVVCNTRQLACLDMAQAHMTDLIEHYKAQHPHDLLAVDIKACIAKLGEITGDDLTEEVLDGVFSRFCVGK